jgi:hypothetical protein
MTYDVVFDVAHDGYQDWWILAVGLLFTAVAATALFVPENLSRGTKIGRSAIFGFAVLWTTLVLVKTIVPFARLLSALHGGRCEVVEGEVTEFHPMPRGGHDQETFVVDGRRFAYSDFIMTPGFRHARSRGGPIGPGLRVRIHHLGNDIARLEVAR